MSKNPVSYGCDWGFSEITLKLQSIKKGNKNRSFLLRKTMTFSMFASAGKLAQCVMS